MAIGWVLAGWYGVLGTFALSIVVLLTLHSDMSDFRKRVDRIRSQRDTSRNHDRHG